MIVTYTVAPSLPAHYHLFRIALIRGDTKKAAMQFAVSTHLITSLKLNPDVKSRRLKIGNHVS